MRQLVVLKPSGPMRLANTNFKIKIGQVTAHPGYPVDPEVLDVFDDTPEGKKDALKAATRYVEMRNTATRHGVTSRKTLAEIYAREAKVGPTTADRKKAFDEAKIITSKGLVDPAEDKMKAEPNAESEDSLLEENEKLKEELAQLKEKKRKLNPRAYLDQNTRTVVSRVKNAAKKKQLKKRDVEEILEAEEKGQARKGVIDKLKNLVKDDIIFGRLFK